MSDVPLQGLHSDIWDLLFMQASAISTLVGWCGVGETARGHGKGGGLRGEMQGDIRGRGPERFRGGQRVAARFHIKIS